jgi:hypothetical protein
MDDKLFGEFLLHGLLIVCGKSFEVILVQMS